MPGTVPWWLFLIFSAWFATIMEKSATDHCAIPHTGSRPKKLIHDSNAPDGQAILTKGCHVNFCGLQRPLLTFMNKKIDSVQAPERTPIHNMIVLHTFHLFLLATPSGTVTAFFLVTRDLSIVSHSVNEGTMENIHGR